MCLKSVTKPKPEKCCRSCLLFFLSSGEEKLLTPSSQVQFLLK